MRNCIHSIRLAVFLLLGIMFGVSSVASTAHAATVSLPLVTPAQPILASTSRFCSYDMGVKNMMVYYSLTSLPVTNLMPYAKATIASPKQYQREEGKVNISANPQLIVPSPASSPSQLIAQEITPATQTITPTSTPIPTQQIQPEQTGSQLNADVLFNMVNEYRARIGRTPFQTDPRVAAIASSRAPELDHEIYGGGGMHAGFFARHLGFWATENMISMVSEQAALTWWLNSPVHRSAIEGDYQYAAVGCAGRSCAMIFTNFAPK